jgi:acyl dehydratase
MAEERNWFDDLAVGMIIESGTIGVSEADILRFAAEFDPQPFHVDAAAAAASPFKGLAASGWHTAALVMRLIVDAKPFGRNPVLGLGVDELRWLAPVRPDRHAARRRRGAVADAVRLASRPRHGADEVDRL